MRIAVWEFVAHYHQERNHQGIGNVLIFPELTPADRTDQFDAAAASAECSIIMSGSHDEPGIPVFGYYEICDTGIEARDAVIGWLQSQASSHE